MSFFKRNLAFILLALPVMGIHNGIWIQSMSNYYVQSTSEIDWKCVLVQITEPGDGTFLINKTALMHSPVDGVPVETPAATFVLNTDASTLVQRTGLRRSSHFQVREDTPDTLILTGLDDPSAYVWTRKNITEFLLQDRYRILQNLIQWGYTTIDKMPLPSFTPECPPRL